MPRVAKPGASLREEIDEAIHQGATAVGETSYTRVHNRIRRDIIVGRFKAGERLKATELAKQYGISPVPIREALQKLAGEGVIIMTPNRGAYVRGVDEDYILQLHEMRILLASHLTASSVVAMTDEVIARLEAIEDVYEAHLHGGDLPVITMANHLFHKTLDTFATNEVMAIAIRNHFDVMRVLRIELGFSEARKDGMVEQHRALIRAARDRDGVTAAELTRRHIQDGCEDFIHQYRTMRLRGAAAGTTQAKARRTEWVERSCSLEL